MEQLLKIGERISLFNKRTCTVESFLGSGTQGEVYSVKEGKNSYALKWYFKENATRELYQSLQEIVRKGSPTNQFLWPLEVVESEKQKGRFGYLMQLRPKEYKNLSGWATMQFRMDFREQITACLQLAESFHYLHAKGLSYQDISFANIFIDPKKGNILICDNDNVSVNGKTVGGVMGTPRFMAPEIVTGKAKPSIATDQYSLAVMLFYILMMSHPLEGKKEAAIKCFDVPAMNKIYGEEPVFIFDPDNDSNRPVKGIHNNAIICWDVYPTFIKDLFTKSFTKGITEPKSRIRESQWQEAFSKLLDSILYCPHCGNENFYHDTVFNQTGKLHCCLPKCKAEITVPARIKIEKKLIMLNQNSCIYASHIDPDCGENARQVVAQVVQNPNNPGIWGIKNLTQNTWTYTNANNQLIQIPQGKSALIKSGAKINFGKSEGEVL